MNYYWLEELFIWRSLGYIEAKCCSLPCDAHLFRCKLYNLRTCVSETLSMLTKKFKNQYNLHFLFSQIFFCNFEFMEMFSVHAWHKIPVDLLFSNFLFQSNGFWFRLSNHFTIMFFYGLVDFLNSPINPMVEEGIL